MIGLLRGDRQDRDAEIAAPLAYRLVFKKRTNALYGAFECRKCGAGLSHGHAQIDRLSAYKAGDQILVTLAT